MARLITNLAAAGAVDHAADLLWLEQSGAPKKVTPNELNIVTATTTELVAIADAINTDAAKEAGYRVFNTTTGSPVWAVDDTDGGLWNDGTGTLAHTPVA